MTNTTEISNQNEIKEPESWECAYNDNAKCPYCGHDNEVEECEYHRVDEDYEEECEQCGKYFFCSMSVSVSFTTTKGDEDAESE